MTILKRRILKSVPCKLLIAQMCWAITAPAFAVPQNFKNFDTQTLPDSQPEKSRFDALCNQLKTRIDQRNLPKLKSYIKKHSNEIRSLNVALLSDIIFAEINRFPTRHPHSKEIFLALAKHEPIPQFQTYVSELKAGKLSKHIQSQLEYWYVPLGSSYKEDKRSETMQSLLSSAFSHKYDTSNLPHIQSDLNNSSQFSINFDRADIMGYVAPDGLDSSSSDFEKTVVLQRATPNLAQTKPLLSTHLLPQKIYPRLHLLKYKPELIKDLVHKATQENYLTLRVFGMIQLGSSQSSLAPFDKRTILKAALKESRQLKSTELTFQALLALSQLPNGTQDIYIKDIHKIIKSSPPELYWERQKVWADRRLQNNLPASRAIYKNLWITGTVSQRIWIMDTIAALKDKTLANYIKNQFYASNEKIRARAVQSLHRLYAKPPKAYPSFVFKDTSTAVQVNLLLFADLTNNKEIIPLISKALASENDDLVYAALTAIISNRKELGFYLPFWSKIQTHFKSKNPEILQQLIRYLDSFNYHDEKLVAPLLKHSNLTIKRSALQLISSQPHMYSASIIRPLVNTPDLRMQAQVLYILIMKNEQQSIENYMRLLSNPWFLYQRELLQKLKARIEKGDVNWKDWLQALLRIETKQQTRIIENLIENRYEIPDSVFDFLYAHLQEFSETSQTLILNAARTSSSKRTLSKKAYQIAQNTSNKSLKQAALKILSSSSDKKVHRLFQEVLENPEPKYFQPLFQHLLKQNAYDEIYSLALNHFSELKDEHILFLFHNLKSTKIYDKKYQALIEKVLNEKSSDFKQKWVSRFRWNNKKHLPQQIINHGFQTIDDKNYLYELVRHVIRLPGQYSKNHVITLLDSQDPDIQAMGIIMAIKKGDPSLYANILPILKNTAKITNKQYIELDPLLSFRLSNSNSLSAHALQALISLNKEKIKPELSTFLNHPSPAVRLIVLSYLRHREIPPKQLKVLQNDPNLEVRFRALGHIWDIEYSKQGIAPNALSFPLKNWLPFLKSKDPNTLMQTIEYLNSYPDFDHQKHLTPLQKHQDIDVRNTIKRVFKEREKFKNSDAFLLYIQSHPYGISELDLDTLPDSISKTELYQQIVKTLRNPATDRLFSFYLVELLLKFENRSIIQDLIVISEHKDLTINRYEAWAQIVSSDDLPQLKKLLQSHSYFQQKFAIDTFETLKTKKHIDEVLRLLPTNNKDLQRAIFRYVGKFGSSSQVAQLLPYLNLKSGQIEIHAFSQNPHPELVNEVKTLLKKTETFKVGVSLVKYWKLKTLAPELITILASKPEDSHLNYLLITTLSAFKDARALPILQKLAKQEQYANVVIPALLNLNDFKNARLALIKILHSGDSDTRVWALIKMREYPDASFISHLIPLIPIKELGDSTEHETSYEIGELAIDVLVEIAEIKTVFQMLRYLKHENNEKQREILYGISEILKKNQPLPQSFIKEFAEEINKQPPDIQAKAKKILTLLK